MTDSIHDRIKSAEEKWLRQVSSSTKSLFSETFIPSHDHSHHHRVWNFSKDLLIHLDNHNSPVTQDLVEGILLAAWFHDTGMVMDSGAEHGAWGKKVFMSFLEGISKKKVNLSTEILEAIELHDTKLPSAYPKLKPGIAPDMLGVLSIADDLDALGIIGIYRYIEIYLKRDIPLLKLGEIILINVKERFRNIRKSCEALPGMTDPYDSSYHIIEEFFTLYNQQLLSERDIENIYWGQLGIVNFIRKFSVESEIRPEDFLNQPELSPAEDQVKNYFYELQKELDLSGC